jgi:cold shock CspA family protein
MRGTVVRLLLAKGYGFVRGDDGVEYFFHAKECEPRQTDPFYSFYEGAMVEYQPIQTEKGPRAVGVTRVKIN